jgi:hypothetical protein
MHVLKQMKEDLKEFYGICWGAPPDIRLEALLSMQDKKYIFKKRESLKKRRTTFVMSKRHLNVFRKDCFVCRSLCDHRHHVISLKQGGTNAKKNVVPLCLLCHMKIHPWLADKI